MEGYQTVAMSRNRRVYSMKSHKFPRQIAVPGHGNPRGLVRIRRDIVGLIRGSIQMWLFLDRWSRACTFSLLTAMSPVACDVEGERLQHIRCNIGDNRTWKPY